MVLSTLQLFFFAISTGCWAPSTGASINDIDVIDHDNTIVAPDINTYTGQNYADRVVGYEMVEFGFNIQFNEISDANVDSKDFWDIKKPFTFYYHHSLGRDEYGYEDFVDIPMMEIYNSGSNFYTQPVQFTPTYVQSTYTPTNLYFTFTIRSIGSNFIQRRFTHPFFNYLEYRYYSPSYDLGAISNYIYTYENGIPLYGAYIEFKLVAMESDDYNNGFTDGYTTGYRDGSQVNGGDGTDLFRLFGYVIDTPILYLKSLFDYEILGVNIFGFFASLLSLCLVLWVLRRII